MSRYIVALLASWPLTCFTPCSDVSRNSEISLQCYLRSGDGPSSSGGQGGGTTKDGQGDDVMGVGDIYLGGVKFVPDFGNQVSEKDDRSTTALVHSMSLCCT